MKRLSFIILTILIASGLFLAILGPRFLFLHIEYSEFRGGNVYLAGNRLNLPQKEDGSDYYILSIKEESSIVLICKDQVFPKESDMDYISTGRNYYIHIYIKGCSIDNVNSYWFP